MHRTARTNSILSEPLGPKNHIGGNKEEEVSLLTTLSLQPPKLPLNGSLPARAASTNPPSMVVYTPTTHVSGLFSDGLFIPS